MHTALQARCSCKSEAVKMGQKNQGEGKRGRLDLHTQPQSQGSSLSQHTGKHDGQQSRGRECPSDWLGTTGLDTNHTVAKAQSGHATAAQPPSQAGLRILGRTLAFRSLTSAACPGG